MAKTYIFKGAASLGAVVDERLTAAGFKRVVEVGSADIVLSYCTSQAELEERYFGEGGFIQEVMPGSLLIDLSATTPNFASEISAVALVSDLAMIEAPIVVADMTSADAFAQENLSCFVAGEEDAVKRALPVLEALVGQVHETGRTGTAQLARAAFTVQVSAQVVAAIEADALYQAVCRSLTGIEHGSFGIGAASPWADSMMTAVSEGRFDGPYTVEMWMAELSAALMAADDAELIIPQAEAAIHLLELLAVVGGADKAPAALSLVYADEAVCAQHGLDWSRAEQAYGNHDDGCGCGHDHDDDGCGCGHHHHHDEYGDYDDYGYDDYGFGYSSN